MYTTTLLRNFHILTPTDVVSTSISECWLFRRVLLPFYKWNCFTFECWRIYNLRQWWNCSSNRAPRSILGSQWKLKQHLQNQSSSATPSLWFLSNSCNLLKSSTTEVINKSMLEVPNDTSYHTHNKNEFQPNFLYPFQTVLCDYWAKTGWWWTKTSTSQNYEQQQPHVRTCSSRSSQCWRLRGRVWSFAETSSSAIHQVEPTWTPSAVHSAAPGWIWCSPRIWRSPWVAPRSSTSLSQAVKVASTQQIRRWENRDFVR